MEIIVCYWTRHKNSMLHISSYNVWNILGHKSRILVEWNPLCEYSHHITIVDWIASFCCNKQVLYCTININRTILFCCKQIKIWACRYDTFCDQRHDRDTIIYQCTGYILVNAVMIRLTLIMIWIEMKLQTNVRIASRALLKIYAPKSVSQNLHKLWAQNVCECEMGW